MDSPICVAEIVFGGGLAEKWYYTLFTVSETNVRFSERGPKVELKNFKSTSVMQDNLGYIANYYHVS
jgi:hypothetical protein